MTRKEIEQAVYQCDGVADAAVLGVPDPVLGEAIRLVVSLSEGSALTERELRLHCQAQLEDFLRPRGSVDVSRMYADPMSLLAVVRP